MNSQFYEQLIKIDGPFFEGFLVLILSILLARLAPLPRSMQPLVWFNHLALNLASKVNRADRSHQQQTTAGLLAAILLIVPFWAIAAFLLELAAYPWFFEFIVIYLCLSDVSFTQVAEEITISVNRNDKEHAKRLLSEWVSQDTAPLSVVGISKTTIEKLATAPIYGTAATIFYFAIAGAPLVLAVRMIKQLDLSWPSLNPSNRHFSRYIKLVSNLLLLVPSLLWSFSLAIQGGPKALAALLTWPKNSHSLGHSLSIQVMAAVLDTELGGPQRYSDQRVDTQKLTYGALPDSKMITKGIKVSTTACIIWFSTIVLIPMLWALLRYLQFNSLT